MQNNIQLTQRGGGQFCDKYPKTQSFQTSNSFKKYLIPSFLTLSAISILNTPLWADITINYDNNTQKKESEGDFTLSQDINISKNSAMSITGNNGTITIDENASITNNKAIDRTNFGVGVGVELQGKVDEFLMNGNISTNAAGIYVKDGQQIGKIIIGENASSIAKNDGRNGLHIRESKVSNIDNKGTLGGGSGGGAIL